jgi:hypothetical protein
LNLKRFVKKSSECKRKHVLHGDSKFVKEIGLVRELTKWNCRIKDDEHLTIKKNAIFHTWTYVIYGVTCAKNKGMACRVQDAFNNEYGITRSIYKENTKVTQSPRSSITKGDVINSWLKSLRIKCKWNHTCNYEAKKKGKHKWIYKLSHEHWNTWVTTHYGGLISLSH